MIQSPLNYTGGKYKLLPQILPLKENKILLEWLDKNSKTYRAVHLKHSYSSSNYHKSDKNAGSDEVLILNYE